MVDGKHLTILARTDDSGLGHQTRDLVRALNPDKVIAIDFSFYNQFKQHPEWYSGYDTTYISGFLTDVDVLRITAETDIVLTAETFYNNNLVDVATRRGVTTLSQVNYEFFEPLSNRNLLLPTKILMPSYWHLDDMRRMTAQGKVMYLPPPTFLNDYREVRQHNIARTGKRRFLHVAGRMAAHDRAGTRDLIEAMKFSTGDFELVIKVQSGEMLQTNDKRITLDYSETVDERDLYKDFDAMIQPRRYAGLNLPMNEALASGLPVIMTAIPPNDKVLPLHWLAQSAFKYSFHARTSVDVFSAIPENLAQRIDEFARIEDEKLWKHKHEAYNIALREYSPEVFLERWACLVKDLAV